MPPIVLTEFLPPQWTMGQKWLVEYFFEQKVQPITGEAGSAIGDNLYKSREVWSYEVYGKELINGVPHLVIRAELQGSECDHEDSFQLYFNEATHALHSFKRRQAFILGQPRIEYVRNPFGAQSFFTSDHHHIILDWPLCDHGTEQKAVGIGPVAFGQKHFVNEKGLTVEFARPGVDTLQTWQKGKPWWSFADKIITQVGREIHIQARLAEDPQTSDEE